MRTHKDHADLANVPQGHHGSNDCGVARVDTLALACGMLSVDILVITHMFVHA